MPYKDVEKQRAYVRKYMRERRAAKKLEDAVYKNAAHELILIRMSKRSEKEKAVLRRKVVEKYGLYPLKQQPTIASGFGTKEAETQFIKALELVELDRIQPVLDAIVKKHADAMFKRLIHHFGELLLKAHMEAASRAYKKFNNGKED